MTHKFSSHNHGSTCSWPQCSYTFEGGEADVFQHNQFHLSSECLHLKSMMLPTGNKICLATCKNYSDIYRSGSLRMCERKHSCLYKTTEDVIRAGISLRKLV